MDKLTDKSYRSYDYISRYTSFPYYYNVNDEKYIYGTTSQLRLDTPYVIHIATKQDTFDSLALKYYNNPTLYWVICDYNRIQDPFSELVEGQRIKIPTLSNIAFMQLQ